MSLDGLQHRPTTKRNVAALLRYGRCGERYGTRFARRERYVYRGKRGHRQITMLKLVVKEISGERRAMEKKIKAKGGNARESAGLE